MWTREDVTADAGYDPKNWGPSEDGPRETLAAFRWALARTGRSTCQVRAYQVSAYQVSARG